MVSTLRPPPTKWIARLLSSECFVAVVVCCLLCSALLVFLCCSCVVVVFFSFFFFFVAAAAATVATACCWVGRGDYFFLVFSLSCLTFVLLFSPLLYYYLLLLLLALCTQRFARYMAMLRSFPEHEPVMLRLDDFVKRTNEYLRSNDLPSGGQLEHLLTRCGDVCSFLFRCFSCCSSLHLLP